MRFSVIATLCAAPLALAGSLQAGLAARGALTPELTVRQESNGNQKGGNSNQNSNNNNNNNQKGNNGNNGNNGGNVIVVQQAPPQQITEVIVIWVNQGGNAATTTLNSQVPPPAAAAPAANAPAANAPAAVAGSPAAAVTHAVTVGGAVGLSYSPSNIDAAIGDMVVFTFMSANHTATQSAFATPCEALAGGMDSGFMPNPNNSIVPAPQMAMQVTVDTPIWFFCKQKGHCGKGMTFSINAVKTGNKTFTDFQQLAVKQNGTGTIPPIAGGAAVAAPAAAAPAANAPAAAPAAAAPAAAAPAAGTANTGSMVSGAGTTGSGGSCTCSCLCGVAAFPNAAVQGIGGFGGLSGAMPMAALEA